jgi:CO dehydrogenase maturation factor
MRIGFLGKGGSGKTTITAAFATWLRLNESRVLAIDGDVNCHLQEALGINTEPPQLGSCYQEIAEYVRGERADLGDRPMLSTTPPSARSRFITCASGDPFLANYSVSSGSLSFMRVGKFSESDVGANCYHTKLHSLCVVLNHLKDTDSDWVVVDATAGVDTLSTSLVVAYDLNVFVVEPTRKSISVYLDYIATDRDSESSTVVIVNKTLADTDEEFVRNLIPGASIIVGSLPLSRYVRDSEQGASDSFYKFVNENEVTWKKLLEECKNRRRGWGAFQSRLHDIHKKNCDWWYNDYYQQTLHTDLDLPFSSD